MWRQRFAKTLILLAGACGLAMLTPVLAAEPVASSARVAEDQLDSTTLRAIFTLRKRRWSDGRPIRVFVLNDDNPVHKDFVRKQLRMFPYQLRQHWNRVVFSGTGAAPQNFDDEESLLNALVSTPDAVGYADSEALPEGVEVMQVAP